MSTHVCRESTNPRHAGRCACGLRMPRSPRDPDYERAFLLEAAKVAAARYGLPAEAFADAVAARLDLGERLYGDRFFREGDGPTEILDEGWDAGAYAVMDAQKRLAAEMDDGAAYHLFEIAVHAAAIDAHARALRHTD